MSDYLGSVPEFAMIVEETVDEFIDGGLRVQLSNVHKFGVRRPNRLLSRIKSESFA